MRRARMPDEELPSPPECFICTESVPPPRKSACKCTDRHVHDACLAKMLETTRHARCPVCAAGGKGFGDHRRNFLRSGCALRSIEKHKPPVTAPVHNRNLRRSLKRPPVVSAGTRRRAQNASASLPQRGLAGRPARAHGGFGEPTSTGSVSPPRLANVQVESHARAFISG